MAESNNSNYFEYNPYQKYEGTEQFNWFKKIDNSVKSLVVKNPALSVISQELSGNNLSVNIFKDNSKEAFLSIDCTKDKIIIRKPGSLNYKEYSEGDIVLKILEDEIK